MPYVMALEGPQLRAVDEIRSKLYSSMPRPFWRASANLNGVADPFTQNKLWVVAGVIFGAWLAGSAMGQGLVKKVVKR